MAEDNSGINSLIIASCLANSVHIWTQHEKKSFYRCILIHKITQGALVSISSRFPPNALLAKLGCPVCVFCWYRALFCSGVGCWFTGFFVGVIMDIQVLQIIFFVLDSKSCSPKAFFKKAWLALGKEPEETFQSFSYAKVWLSLTWTI